MTKEVRNPYTTFDGLAGLPLTGGKVFIGQVNADPESYPVATYWDAAGTIPAAQPIETAGGYLINPNTMAPGRIYAATNAFSIRVRNALGQQVFYLADASSLTADGASSLGFEEVGVGAIVQSVEQKLRSIGRSPFGFDALGNWVNGNVDDAQPQLQAMLDAAGLDKGDMPFLNGIYYINQPLIIREGTQLGSLMRHGFIPLANTEGFGERKGTIVCGPNGKIVLEAGASMQRVNVISLAAATEPTSQADAIAKLATWDDYPVGIECQQGHGDILIWDDFVAGFETGIVANFTERVRIGLNRIDALNGIYLTRIYDTPFLMQNHLWPYTIAQRGYTGEVLALYDKGVHFAATGTGGEADRSTDGGTCIGGLNYGFKWGWYLEATNTLNVISAQVDNDPAFQSGKTGFYAIGNCRRTNLIACSSDGCGAQFDMQNVGTIKLTATTAAGGIGVKYNCGPDADVTFTGCYGTGGTSAAEVQIQDGNGRVEWDQFNFGLSVANPPIAVPAVAKLKNVDAGKVRLVEPQMGAGKWEPRKWSSAVEVRGDASQAVSAASITTITLNTEIIDTLSEFNTANNKFVAARDGFYLVTLRWHITPANTSNSANIITLRKNGAEAARLFQINTTSGASVRGVNTEPMWLSAGDEVDAQVEIEIGGVIFGPNTILTVNRLTDMR